MHIHDLVLLFTLLPQVLMFAVNYEKKPILSDVFPSMSLPYLFILSDTMCNIVINSCGFFLHFILLYDMSHVDYLIIPQYITIIHFYITLIFAICIQRNAKKKQVRIRPIDFENIHVMSECNICYEEKPSETFPEYRCLCSKKSICGICLMKLVNQNKECPWCRQKIYEITLKVV